MENKNIIEGIKRGDKNILTDFYIQNIQNVQSYVIKNNGCKEDVEDVFQDALVLIYQKLKTGSLEVNHSIHAYFYGVCKNIWRNRLRSKKKLLYRDNLTQETKCNDDCIIENIERLEQQVQLYLECFSRLSNSYKKILNLYFKGLNMKEIASLMGYSEGYARKKKFEAKKRLLEMVEQNSS